MDEFFIGKSCRARSLGETGIGIRVGKNTRQRIQLENMGLSEFIQPDVDSTPVPAPQGLECFFADGFNFFPKGNGDLGWAGENLHGSFHRIPNPLGFIRIYRIHIARKLLQLDLHNGQHLNRRTISQQGYGKFPSREEFFYQGG
jgi:hypothetical protein